MYKAIFHIAKDRATFLKLLLSRPLAGTDAPGPDASVMQLTAHFSNTKADENIFESNLAEIGRMIRDVFHIPISSKDQATLRHIYGAFRKRGLKISYWNGPTLKEMLEEKGPDGRQQNFLATREDYEFLRDLQLRNQIIPVVGDFAGPKAVRSVANYLSENSYSVSVFYTSNVEEILDMDGKFEKYVLNIIQLPITTGSFFLRWPGSEGSRTMLFQQMTVFLKYYEQSSIYLDHDRLLRTKGIRVKNK
jgi:hypothetical protein